MREPPSPHDPTILNRIKGSLIGMAIGDALGASVEFRPRQYLLDNPVTDFQGGGTWGLKAGQVCVFSYRRSRVVSKYSVDLLVAASLLLTYSLRT